MCHNFEQVAMSHLSQNKIRILPVRFKCRPMTLVTLDMIRLVMHLFLVIRVGPDRCKGLVANVTVDTFSHGVFDYFHCLLRKRCSHRSTVEWIHKRIEFMIWNIKIEFLNDFLFFILFKIFIFCPKIQLWFLEKIVDFFGWKTREKVGFWTF